MSDKGNSYSHIIPKGPSCHGKGMTPDKVRGCWVCSLCTDVKLFTQSEKDSFAHNEKMDYLAHSDKKEK